MIWDCFMFGGPRELDLLELRLRTLSPYVDRFVICEAAETFQGTPKPLAYPAAAARFGQWDGQIAYLVAPPVGTGDPWVRERAQRDYLQVALNDAGPDDIVLMGDMDEIPDLERWKPPTDRPQVIVIRQHVFAVDWVHSKAIPGTAVIPWRFWLEHDRPPFRAVRDLRMRFAQHWGGWHFSWLGGPEAIRAKVAAHAHLELNEKISDLNDRGQLYECGWVPWDEVWQMPAKVNGTWPEWIRNRDCPATWFRPLAGDTLLPKSPPSRRA